MNRSIRFLVTKSMTYLFVFVAGISTSAQTSSTKQEVIQKLDQIRAIQATSDEQLLNKFNKQLDDAWTFFKNNKEDIIPILASQLRIERQKAEPDDYLLLDIGYFLYLEGDEDMRYKEEAKEALYSLDPKDEVVLANLQQLFYFVHKIAADRDPRILSFIDKAFLYDQVDAIYIPQHSMKLDATLMCVFLYGVFGQDSEEHLKMLLNEPEIANKVIELLIWIGTNNSVDEVSSAMLKYRNHTTFVRALAYMIQTGGPAGKELVLGVDLQNFDVESQQYYNKVKSSINDISYELLKDGFGRFAGDAELPTDEVKKRLQAMYENYGKDDNTNPMVVLNSKLPKEFLIRELLKIRSRMFYRISDEALSDVKSTNVLINALHYRPD